MAQTRVRVYLASSLDGFIAGPDDDLSWLEGPNGPNTSSTPGMPADMGGLAYEDFIADVGSLLMGRRTYDVVRGFDVPWPYGDRPVLVATHRPLDPDPPTTVRAVQGSIRDMIASAKEAAGDADVYLDGGVLIRAAAEEDLIDDLTLTFAPIALGAGHPLFAGMSRRYPLDILSFHPFTGGMLQVRARPRRD